MYNTTVVISLDVVFVFCLGRSYSPYSNIHHDLCSSDSADLCLFLVVCKRPKLYTHRYSGMRLVVSCIIDVL